MKLAYIIGTYPSLTTTFIDREVNTLRNRGVEIQILAMRRPQNALSPEQAPLQSGVIYLLPISLLAVIRSHFRFAFSRPSAYFGTLFYLLTRPHPGLRSIWMTFLHFTEGVCAAELLQTHACDHLHAHFMDRASTVALVTSRLLGISYSLTAHAADIYVRPILAVEKLSNAAFVATCTGYNQAYLMQLTHNGVRERVKCIYHGLNVANYHPVKAAGRPVLLCVGQLKEKKGITFLLQACRLLKDAGYEFTCEIVGEGPLQSALMAEIHQLGLEGTVTLCGALPHDQVIRKYAEARVFVLPAVVGANGDRDGIPNVILEAMAMKLPVVSTQHSGIPEVLEDEVNGLLVPPADAMALKNAIARLLDDPETARQYGERGRQTVAERFDLGSNVGKLLAEFEHAIAERTGHVQ